MRYLMLISVFSISFYSHWLSAGELSYNSHHNVSYIGGYDSKYQSLDIHVPLPASNQNLLPVHVYIHGGAWTKGDKSRLTSKQIHSYTKQGIILVSVNYRLAPKHRYPANISDIVRASLWLKSHIHDYGGDRNKMILSGHSAGAHLAALAGVSADELIGLSLDLTFRAIFCVDTASYDLTKKSTGYFSKWIERQKYKTFGKTQVVLKQASPIFQVESTVNYSPFYLYVTELRPGAISEMKRFAQVLHSNGHTVKTVIIKGGLSHADMLDAVFDPNHSIYKTISSVLQ